MSVHRFPGFTAEAGLYRTSTRDQLPATRDHSRAEQRVISQLRVGTGVPTMGLGFHWPSWCELACASAAAVCLAGTAGAAAALCIPAEIACLQACNSFQFQFA
jgi:hypothetical protein